MEVLLGHNLCIDERKVNLGTAWAHNISSLNIVGVGLLLGIV